MYLCMCVTRAKLCEGKPTRMRRLCLKTSEAEAGNLGSESKCSSTAPSWDLYVESGDNVVNAKAGQMK